MLAFNRMVGGWNLGRNNIFTLAIDRWTLTPQIQQYWLGPGARATATQGAFNGPRPQRIERARLVLSTTPTPVYRELDLLTDNEWADKSVQQIVGMPTELYNSGSSPLSLLYFYMIPDQPYQMDLYTWQSLSKAPALDALLDFPDGYEEAIVTNLACKVAPMFQKPVTPDMRLQATVSLQALQAFNAPTPRLRTEPGLSGNRGSYYNWRSGLTER